MPMKNCLRNDLSPTKLPCVVNYGDKADAYFTFEIFRNDTAKNLLGKYRWLAKFKLKYAWSIVALTNIQEHHGCLSSGLIDEIISIHFPKQG